MSIIFYILNLQSTYTWLILCIFSLLLLKSLTGKHCEWWQIHAVFFVMSFHILVNLRYGSLKYSLSHMVSIHVS